MNIFLIAVMTLLSIGALGYGSNVLRADRSSISGSWLLAIGAAIFAAIMQMFVGELFHYESFTRVTFFIVPGLVYCLPFLRLLLRRVSYSKMIVPFLVGIPVLSGCGFVVGFAVACAMGDCV